MEIADPRKPYWYIPPPRPPRPSGLTLSGFWRSYDEAMESWEELDLGDGDGDRTGREEDGRRLVPRSRFSAVSDVVG